VGVDASTPAPSGVFAAVSDASGSFGGPMLLADAPTATLPQPTGVAIGPTSALVAWSGPQGAEVARSVAG
jgi:hypothetical protein